jgi:hypothetical protein
MARPARQRRSPHTTTCRHCPRVRLLGRDYQAQRAAWEAQREHVTHGYATEQAEFDATHRPPTFKTYLIAMTGSAWPMSGRQPARSAAA